MKKSKGFTLTEVLVMIAIFLIVTVAIYSAHVLSQRAYRESEMMAEITQNGRVILERMTREVRQAKEIAFELPLTRTDATTTIEFEDGHTPIPSPYGQLNSDYYYIRYYLAADSHDVKRQYRVYCFDTCGTFPNVCTSYHRWNATRETTPTSTHPCVLEEKIIGEYVSNLKFWGSRIINIFITLEKANKKIDLETKVFGRNL